MFAGSAPLRFWNGVETEGASKQVFFRSGLLHSFSSNSDMFCAVCGRVPVLNLFLEQRCEARYGSIGAQVFGREGFYGYGWAELVYTN